MQEAQACVRIAPLAHRGGPIRFLALLLLLLAPSWTLAAQASGGRLDLQGWNFASQGPVILAGQWQFAPGRLVDPRAPWPADATTIAAPAAWQGVHKFAYGSGTYRLVVDCTPGQPLALAVPFEPTAMALFVNGRLYAAQGRPGLSREDHVPAMAHQTVLLQEADCPLDIRVQMSNFELYRAGMIRGLTLGTPQQLVAQRESDVARNMVAVSACLMVGIFGLFSFAVWRRDPTGIALGLSCVAMGLYVGFSPDSALQSWISGIGFEGRIRLWFGNSWLLWATHPLVAHALFPRHSWRVMVAALIGFCLTGLAFALFAPLSWVVLTGPLSWLSWMAVSAYVFIVIGRAAWRRERSAFIILLALAILMTTVIHDLRSDSHLVIGSLLPFGQVALVLALALLLAQRFGRALAAEELRAVEQKHRADLLVRATKAGVLDWEVSTGVMRASERYREMFGLPADCDAALLPPVRLLLHPADRDAVTAIMAAQEQRRSGAGLHRWEPVEFRMLHQGGSVVWVHLEAVSLTADDGRPIRHICTFIDISQLKSAEERLREAQSELVKEARRAGMAQIATNVLHNVGNVLTSVNVSAHVISNRLEGGRSGRLRDVADLLEAEMRQLDAGETNARMRMLPGYVRGLADAIETERAQALDEVRRLFSSVDHIKNVVAMQQSYAGVAGVKEEVSLATLAEDALRMKHHRLERERVRIERDFAETSPSALDRVRIIQILVNLIDNACDAMAAVTGERLLRLVLRQEAGWLQLSVADNGSGISPEHRATLFAHGFTTRAEGHGFGLHSCAVAAREMGGDLSAESEGPGRGAVFTLRIPC